MGVAFTTSDTRDCCRISYFGSRSLTPQPKPRRYPDVFGHLATDGEAREKNGGAVNCPQNETLHAFLETMMEVETRQRREVKHSMWKKKMMISRPVSDSKQEVLRC